MVKTHRRDIRGNSGRNGKRGGLTVNWFITGLALGIGTCLILEKVTVELAN